MTKSGTPTQPQPRPATDGRDSPPSAGAQGETQDLRVTLVGSNARISGDSRKA